jgi:Glyoxalase-like domain
MLTLDHIAIACEDLETGTAHVEAALGVDLSAIGEHPHMGTHNRLLSLGRAEYLEVIAINPGAPGPDQPRWFDIDSFAGPPRITNWICRAPDLAAALAMAPEGSGMIWDLARGDFRWRMAIPGDGKLPFDGGFPALIEWQGTAHPAPRLRDDNIRLTGLTLTLPAAEALSATLASLITDNRLQIAAGPAPRITATFSTPAGAVTL